MIDRLSLTKTLQFMTLLHVTADQAINQTDRFNIGAILSKVKLIVNAIVLGL